MNESILDRFGRYGWRSILAYGMLPSPGERGFDVRGKTAQHDADVTDATQRADTLGL